MCPALSRFPENRTIPHLRKQILKKRKAGLSGLFRLHSQSLSKAISKQFLGYDSTAEVPSSYILFLESAIETAFCLFKLTKANFVFGLNIESFPVVFLTIAASQLDW